MECKLIRPAKNSELLLSHSTSAHENHISLTPKQLSDKNVIILSMNSQIFILDIECLPQLLIAYV